MAKSEMKIKAIAPWFGANRGDNGRVGRLLGKLAWCGVPFAGGMSEVPGIVTRGGVANDLHQAVINLAMAIRTSPDALAKMLDSRLFHPNEIDAAKRVCREKASKPGVMPDFEWAAAYAVCVWMGRGGVAGTPNELEQSLSARFTATGGSSARRYRSMIDSLVAWFDAFKPWEFSCIDAMAFLDKVRDRSGYGVYADPPWPDAGKGFEHRVNDAVFHELLAGKLGTFSETRVLVRYGDCPLIRKLYPAGRWRWLVLTTRNQANNAVAEALIANFDLPAEEIA